jgi:hypothetical protein
MTGMLVASALLWLKIDPTEQLIREDVPAAAAQR